MTDMRETFEKWMTDQGGSGLDLERWIRNTNQYSSQLTQAAWEGWQGALITVTPRASTMIIDQPMTLAIELARVAHAAIEDGKMRLDVGLLLLTAVQKAAGHTPVTNFTRDENAV